jgi:Rieske Fe-S protein
MVSPNSHLVNRRGLLGWLAGAAMGAVTSILGVLSAGAVLTPPSARRRDGWIDAAPLEAISARRPTEVSLRVEREDGYRLVVDRRVVYVVREGARTRALSAVCTHLGCRVAWHEAERELRCPCHGGRFDASGIVTGGPPRRALDELDTRVENGRILVRLT